MNKHYYYKSQTTEEFYAEYGVYDQNNLSAGVIARMVNNPKYTPVSRDEYYKGNPNPNAKGWYVYNSSTGTFGLSLDTSVDVNTQYYTASNNTESYTYIKGQHIVIGYDESRYTGIPQAEMDRINTYFQGNYILDGTITEIASDAAYCKAFFVEHLEFEEAVGQYLELDGYQGEWANIGYLSVTGGGDDEIVFDVYGDSIFEGNISGRRVINSPWGNFDTLEINGITFGDGYLPPSADDEDDEGSSTECNDPADIVMGFDTPTVDGDDVTIPFITAGMDEFDDEHVITFTKPASIGHAVWSSGSGNTHDLKVYTVGGWNGVESPQWTFYHAVITYPTNYVDGAEDSEGNPRISYARKGSDVGAGGSSPLKDIPTIKAHVELSGEDYDKDGHNVGLFHDDTADDTPVISGWSKFIYVDASPAYDDGFSQGWSDAIDTVGAECTYGGEDFTDGEDVDLGYSDSATVKAGYFDEGGTWHTTDGIKVKSPSKGSYQTYAKKGNTEYTSGTIALGYSDEVTVYGQRKMDGDDTFESATGIKITSPADNSSSISGSDIDIPNDGFDVSSSEPSGTKLTNLRNAINEAIRDGKWLYFKVKVTGTDASKQYYMDFT